MNVLSLLQIAIVGRRQWLIPFKKSGEVRTRNRQKENARPHIRDPTGEEEEEVVMADGGPSRQGGWMIRLVHSLGIVVVGVGDFSGGFPNFQPCDSYVSVLSFDL